MAQFDVESISLLQKMSRHTSDVTSCDFGRDFRLATGSGDKTVFVYEWKQGLGYVEANFSPLTGHKYSVTCVRFSPLSSLLATASVDGHTNLWDSKTGVFVQSLVQENGNAVRCLSFSRDGCLLATAGEGGTLCVWSITIHSNSLIRAINGHDEESIQGVSFSPDGLLLVSGDVTGSFKVWSVPSIRDDTSSLQPLMTARDVHDLGINDLEFSPEFTAHNDARTEGLIEREYLLGTCGNDHSIALWQINTMQAGKDSTLIIPSPAPDLIARLLGHNSAVSQIRISPKGDLLTSTSIDKTARIWQISSGRCLKTIEEHSRYVTSCAFSPDQTILATGSNDKMVFVWDLTGSINADSLFINSQPFAFHSSLSVSSMLSKSLSCKDIRLVHKLNSHNGSVNTLDLSNRYLISGGSDHKIIIWSWSGLNPMKLIHSIESHRYSVNQVEIWPDSGIMATCSLDGTVILWNPENGQMKKSGFHVSGSAVRCVRLSSDKNLIAAGGDDDLLQIYRLDTCGLIASVPGDGEGITCIAFSPDSKFVMVGSADGHSRLYSLSPISQPPNPHYVLENNHDLGVSAMDFSETLHVQLLDDDERYEIATCGQDSLVKVWNIKVNENIVSATIVWTLTGHGGGVTCVRYSPKLAEMIASTSTDKTCRLWDSYSGDCLHVVESQDGILTCCAFSPDATILATGCMNKSIFIWEMPKDLAFRSFIVHRSNSALNVESWNVDNVNNWLESFGLPPCNLTGSTLLTAPIKNILAQLNIEDESKRNEMTMKLNELRKDCNKTDPPHEFLCPITHQLMQDPVIAADGHNYERVAIQSWFSAGHDTSPMTNSPMITQNLVPNVSLKESILLFLS